MLYGELVPVLTLTLSTFPCAQIVLRCTCWLCCLVNLQLGSTSQPHCGLICADTKNVQLDLVETFRLQVTENVIQTDLNLKWNLMINYTYAFRCNLLLRFLVPSSLCFPVLHFYVFCPSLYVWWAGIRKRNGHTSSRTHTSTPCHPEEEWQPLLVALPKVCENFSPRNP